MQKVLYITKSNRIKRYFLLRSVLIISALFLSVISASAQEEIGYSAKTFVGEAFNFEGKTIRFKEVVSDSRCPGYVTCIWAGEAKIMIEIFENENLMGEEIISTRLQNFSLAKFFDGDFSLNSVVLLPYPKTSRTIKDSDYRLQFKITEKAR